MDRSVKDNGAMVKLVLPRSTIHGWRRIATAVSAAAALALTGCAAANADTPGGATASATLPDLVMIKRPGLYPEGVEWDAKRQRFLVSSAADGSVTAVQDDGTLSTLDSGEGLTSTLGTYIDEDRDRLLATVADFAAVEDSTQPGEAALAIYDLTSGRRTALVPLAGLRPHGRHLANDVTADSLGNAYVTDSFTSAIYKVTPDGQASVLVEDPRLGSSNGLGLNGIEYDPDGFLFAAVAGAHKLFRIPIDNPTNLTDVVLPEPISIDGIARQPNGNLVVAAPFTPAVITLSTSDEWATAQIVDKVAVAATDTTTNTTVRGGAVYAVNAHFAQMHEPKPVQVFEICRVGAVN
jgi:sugar lactone lactonase YvrE